jgi:hypothetical protein
LDLKEKIRMEDIVGLLLTIFVLTIYLSSCRKDFNNWKSFSALEKSHLIRFPILMFGVIIIVIIKIALKL